MPDSERLPKRLAVVGAGSAGLATIKDLFEEGREPQSNLGSVEAR